jgi:hypothetical protein
MFSAIYSGQDGTYRLSSWDESLRHSRVNALACRRDTFINARLNERKFACSQLRWSIEPEDSNNQKWKELATAITKQIHRIPDLQGYLSANLESIWFGRAGTEMTWEWEDRRSKRELNVVDWFPVNGDKWAFDRNNIPGVLIHAGSSYPGALVKQTDRGRALMLHTPYWRERFTLNFHEKIDADFYEGELAGQRFGVGVRNFVYWYWYLLQEMVSYILDFMQRVGLGVTIFYFDASNPVSQQLAITAAKQQSRNNTIVFPRFSGGEKAPEGVERLEVPTAGAEYLLKIVKEYFEEHIREYINGQDLSSQADKSGGLGSSVADLHADTKSKITSADAQKLEGCLTRDLVRVMQKWTYPETVDECELRWKFSIDKPNAAEALQAANTIFAMGGKLDYAEVMGLAGLSVPKEGAEILSQAQMQQEQAQMQQQQQAAMQPQQPGQPGAEGQPQGDEQQLSQMLEGGQPQPPPAPPPSANGNGQANGKPKGPSTNGAPAFEAKPTPLATPEEVEDARNATLRDRHYAGQAPHNFERSTVPGGTVENEPLIYEHSVEGEPRDQRGRWSQHEHFKPVSSDLEREKAINHYHPRLSEIPEGDLHHVWGHLIRKTGPDEFRTETERGHLTGPANVVLDHISRQWKAQKPHLGKIGGAMARVEAWHEPDIFKEHDRAAREAAAFEAMPHGAEVVSLHPTTFGRVGEVVKQAEAVPTGKTVMRNRVRLAGSPEFSSSDVEPLDEKHSWRKTPTTGQPAYAQGSLFEGEDRHKKSTVPGGTVEPKGGMAQPMDEDELAKMFEPQFAGRADEQATLFQREQVLSELDSPEFHAEVAQYCRERGIDLVDGWNAIMQLRHETTVGAQ